MVKKIGNAGLLVGGLLAVIGAVGAIVNSVSVNVSGTISMAVLSRVGAIISFVTAIIIIAAAVMAAEPKKGGAVAKLIFGVLAFVGQFLINPITGLKAAANAAFSSSAQSAIQGAFIGLIFLAVSGLVLLIMGIVGLASKNKTTVG